MRQAFADCLSTALGPASQCGHGLLELKRAEAARAVAAATPLLVKAERVVSPVSKSMIRYWLTDRPIFLVSWLGRESAEVEFMSSAAGPAGEVLKATARSHQADLLVMGGYGHSRMREIVFGGFTQSVLESG